MKHGNDVIVDRSGLELGQQYQGEIILTLDRISAAAHLFFRTASPSATATADKESPPPTYNKKQGVFAWPSAGWQRAGLLNASVRLSASFRSQPVQLVESPFLPHYPWYR